MPWNYSVDGGLRTLSIVNFNVPRAANPANGTFDLQPIVSNSYPHPAEHVNV
jgi:hypothetical protein